MVTSKGQYSRAGDNGGRRSAAAGAPTSPSESDTTSGALLLEAHGCRWDGAARVTDGDTRWREIAQLLHPVPSAVVEYTAQFDNPGLVVETLPPSRATMDDGTFMNRRLHGWGFAKMHAQIWYQAAATGFVSKQ